jgi:hypothetical protein
MEVTNSNNINIWQKQGIAFNVLKRFSHSDLFVRLVKMIEMFNMTSGLYFFTRGQSYKTFRRLFRCLTALN